MTMDSADWGQSLAADTLRFERTLPGTPERLWPWLADSEKRARWLAAGVLPDQPGAAFTLTFEYEGTPVQTRHTVRLYEPPSRLCITWDEGEDWHSEVTFELSALTADQVRLCITHRRLRQADRVDVASGWHAHLALLSALLTGTAAPDFMALHRELERAYQQRLEV